MRFNKAWDFLLWCDPSNFGGVKSKMPKDAPKKKNSENEDFSDDENEDNEREMDDDDDDDDEDGIEIEMNWNLASYLPESGACQKNFSTVIAGYISAVFNFIVEENERVAPGSTPIRRRKGSQTPQSQRRRRITGESLSIDDYSKDLIAGELSQRLFAVTQKIHQKLPPELANHDNDSAFPHLPGSHLKLTNPALEFIKALHKVLSLDSAITEEMSKLRRNLLKLISVGEFGDDAVWNDPCVSFVLPEVICKQCNHCRDLDLCKDSNQTVSDAGIAVWTCPGCKAPYESAEIEDQLIDALQRRTMGFVLQDLQCKKCGEVKATNMAAYCSCAGQFKNLQFGTDDVDKMLKTFKGIAEHYKMHILLNAVEWFTSLS